MVETAQANPSTETDAAIAAKLLAWYEQEGRSLPWRTPPGSRETPDAYRVWLSEVMLQQTTVKAVLPRYGRFLRRWPTVEDLAAAPLGDVLAEWAGLGYYARARNLHACAKTVVAEYGGVFPNTEAALRTLPGVGAYTAAAIAAIAFGARATPVDGNIERVMARLFGLEKPLPEAKPEIKALAGALTPPRRPGDFAQSLMDLGALICTPKSPACGLCPIRPHCSACRRGLAAVLPYKAQKVARPTRLGAAFLAIRKDGAVLLRERPPEGLLGGMLEVPSSPWEATPDPKPRRWAPLKAGWRKRAGLVRHTFTHFHLTLEVHTASVAMDAAPAETADPARCRWVLRRDLSAAALPSVMRKVLRLGLGE